MTVQGASLKNLILQMAVKLTWCIFDLKNDSDEKKYLKI